MTKALTYAAALLLGIGAGGTALAYAAWTQAAPTLIHFTAARLAQAAHAGHQAPQDAALLQDVRTHLLANATFPAEVSVINASAALDPGVAMGPEVRAALVRVDTSLRQGTLGWRTMADGSVQSVATPFDARMPALPTSPEPLN